MTVSIFSKLDEAIIQNKASGTGKNNNLSDKVSLEVAQHLEENISLHGVSCTLFSKARENKALEIHHGGLSATTYSGYS